MKNLIALFIAFTFAIGTSFAQQKPITHHLMVTVIETGAPQLMIITNDDGTQEQRKIHIPDMSLFHLTKSFMAHEDSVLQVLKPFFNDNWKLINTTPISTTSSSVIVRYFFTKEDE